MQNKKGKLQDNDNSVPLSIGMSSANYPIG